MVFQMVCSFATEKNSSHLNGWLEYWNTLLSLLGQAHPIFQGLHIVYTSEQRTHVPWKGAIVLRECIYLQFPTPSVGCDCSWRWMKYCEKRINARARGDFVTIMNSKGPTPGNVTFPQRSEALVRDSWGILAVIQPFIRPAICWRKRGFGPLRFPWQTEGGVHPWTLTLNKSLWCSSRPVSSMPLKTLFVTAADSSFLTNAL